VVGAAITITLKKIAFNPTIRSGQSVTWVWDDNHSAHNADFDSLKSQLQTEAASSTPFDILGIYPFRWDIHPNMNGIVEVTRWGARSTYSSVSVALPTASTIPPVLPSARSSIADLSVKV
jgi:hypothetical protein